MSTGARLAQLVFSATADNFATKIDERLEHLLQRQHPRLAVDDGEIDHAKARLHRRQLEQLIEDDLRHRIALQFDNQAHSVTIRFVTHVRNAFDLLFIGQLSDALVQLRFVDLERKLGNDDRVSLLRTAADAIDRRLGAHLNDSAAGKIRTANLFPSTNEPTRRKVRAFDDL